MLTQGRLKELLYYDPETGDFRWRVDRARNAKAGMVAGKLCGGGYIRIKVDGRLYMAHRLAWLYMTGDWPVHEVDHVNRVRTDNRWSNLREATHQENGRNNPSKGFHWNKRAGKWRAQIMVDGNQLRLGLFDCMLDARAAYLRARREHFGEFA